jgi:hypothetical protein
MSARSFASVVSSLTFAAVLVLLLPLLGQTQDQPAEGGGSRTPPFKAEELEAIVAPIALYQDSLLAQIFMASTYPLEVVEAARWSKEHPDVKGDAVADAIKDQPWDLSVKSLVAFPQVLTMMNEKLDWTQKLGDAFLAQQADVMQAVQRLRNKAMETGNLKSSKEVTVKTEPAPPPPPPAEGAPAAAAPAPPPQTIIIESPDPEVVYVPTYNPTVVYGGWGYPSYPPYYYYPPGYAAGAAFWSFTAGVVVGGALWGDCNWGGNDIDIDVNRENNFNRNTERNVDRSRTSNKWEHNSDHRKGVGYRDSGTQQKYGRGNSQGTQAREQYRGRAEQGRQEMAREGVGNQRDLAGNQVGSRDAGRAGAQDRSLSGGQSRDLGGASDRGSTPQAGNRATSAQSRDAGASRNTGSASRSTGSASRSAGSSASRSSASRSSAFSGAGNASASRASASRGMSSRSSAGARGGGGRRR